MNTPDLDIVATGLNVVDFVLKLPEEVISNEKYEVETINIQGGGPAGNASCLVSHLGMHTGFITRMGNNSISNFSRNEFRSYGVVENCFISTPEARPGISIIQFDPSTGDRTVFYNLDRYEWLSPDDIPADTVGSADLVIADDYDMTAAETILDHARNKDVPSVINFENGTTDDMKELLTTCAHCIFSINRARSLTDQRNIEPILQTLSGWTSATVIVTDGERGSWAARSNETIYQPAFDVDLVDSTGCGDTYFGAYAYALLQDCTLPQRLEFASWVAACVANGYGGRGHIPAIQDIQNGERLSDNVKQTVLPS